MFAVRPVLAALVALALILPVPAFAVSMMDPFNLPAAMDGGTAKVGDGIAYGDGARNKLDVYAPEQRGTAAPVVFFICSTEMETLLSSTDGTTWTEHATSLPFPTPGGFSRIIWTE